MDGYISYSQLGMFVLLIVVVVFGIYAILTLRNINVVVRNIGAIIHDNQVALGRAIPSIALAAENVVAITTEVRNGFSETGKALETADQIASYAVVIGETAKAVAGLFTSGNKG